MDGWNINDKLAAYYFDDQKLPENAKELQKVLIDEDLREYGEPIFQNLINKSTAFLDLSNFPKVVQLVKYRNVQIPKIRENNENYSDNSGVFRIFLTDGHSTVSGIIMENIKGLTTETPPGTKFQLIGKITIESNFLLLTRNNVNIIGGNVEKLVEKWKIEKSGEKTTKSASLAPKWIPFGKRQKQGETQKLDKNFKANQVLPKKECAEDDTTDFAKNRVEALKNLGNEDQKVFSRPNVQAPEKVVTQPQTKPRPQPAEKPERNPKKNRRGRRNSEDDDEPLPDYVKPGVAPTLFDFIGASTGIEEEIQNLQIQKASQPQPQKPNKFAKNVPSSANNNPRNNTPRGNGNQRGNRGDPKSFTPRGNQAQNDNPQRKQENQQPRGYPKNQNQGPSSSQGQRNNNNRGGPNNRQEQDREPKRNDNRNEQKSFKPREHHGNRHDQEREQGRNDNRNEQKSFKSREHQGNRQDQEREPKRNDNRNEQKSFTPREHQGPNQSQKYSNQRDGKPPGNRQQIGENPRKQFNEAPNYQQNTRGNNQINQVPAQFQQPLHHQQQQQQQQHNQAPIWQIGSQCMAPWQDGRIYPAEILQFLPNRMCVIRYTEYGNVTEISIDILMYC